LPVFFSRVSRVFLVFVSLVFAVDGLAQTPAEGPIQMAQAAGGASQGASLAGPKSGVASTMVAVVAAGVAAVAAVASSNSTGNATAANH
jgi:hypothetical protein